jgi:hypothetical protein
MQMSKIPIISGYAVQADWFNCLQIFLNYLTFQPWMKTQHRSNFGCIWWKWFKAHIYLKLHFRGKSQPCFHFIGCFSTTKVDIQFQCVSQHPLFYLCMRDIYFSFNILNYLGRSRRRDVCNFHMIYIDDIIHNCMRIIFWTWKWYIESSWIKWNRN